MSIWTSRTRRTGGGVGVWAFRPVGPGLQGGGGYGHLFQWDQLDFRG